MFNSNAVRPCAQSPHAMQRVPAVAYDTQRLIATVGQHLDVAPEAITAHTRDKTAARARLIVMYLLREDARLTLTAIARLLDRDHSTVISGHARIAGALAYDRPLRMTIEAVRLDMRPTLRATLPATWADQFEYLYWRSRARRDAHEGRVATW